MKKKGSCCFRDDAPTQITKKINIEKISLVKVTKNFQVLVFSQRLRSDSKHVEKQGKNNLGARSPSVYFCY